MHGFIPIRRELLLLLTLLPMITGCAVIPGRYGIPKIVGMSAETAAVVQRANHRQVARVPNMALLAPAVQKPTVGVPQTVSIQPTHQPQHHAPVAPAVAAPVHHPVATLAHHQQPVLSETPVTVVHWQEPVQPLRRVPPPVETVAMEEPGVVQLSGQHPRSQNRSLPRRLAQRPPQPTLSRIPPPSAPVAKTPVPAIPVASELVVPPVTVAAAPVIPQAQATTARLPSLPCDPCVQKPAVPAKPPQIHTDQIAALVKRVASMEAELQSSNQSIVTLHKALMQANAEVKRLNASVTRWQSEVKRLEVAMQTQHESDIDSLNRISEMLGVLAETETDTAAAAHKGTP